MKLSIVIPCYFESGIVKTAYDRVKKEVLSGTDDYELIFVDDGSTDSTYAEIAEVANQDPKVMAIKLSSNVGSHMAIRVGLSYATGDCACFIACDMQEPPELITKMKGMIT